MSAAVARPATAALRVALVGNPNAGKSTLFNALTGLRQHVANFPGVTVERVEGQADLGGTAATILDLPGAYSLQAASPDEKITCDALQGRTPGAAPPDVVVLVVDAETLGRQLFLATEVLDLGRPTVIALNRMDRASAAGIEIDVPELIHHLGATVVPIVAKTGEGLDRLRRAIALAPTLPLPTARSADPDDAPARYRRIAAVMAACVTQRSLVIGRWSDRLDAVMLHRVWGPVIFVAVLGLVFQGMFTLAKPLGDALQALVASAGATIADRLPEGNLRSLLADGLFAGVGSVLTFLPQIAILFIALGILEDTGYMARAAFVLDRVMRPFGLHGRSVIPLLSGHACAVPAMMSTRTIPDRAERLATLLVVPLTSCSARLPVYALLVAAFVPAESLAAGFTLQGVALLGMYLAGLVAALASAALLRRTVLAAPTRGLILELPRWAVPTPRVLFAAAWQRVRLFLQRAGTVIVAISVLLWALASFPKHPAAATATPEQRLEYSALGRLGHAIEPAVRPLGFDWQIGVSMLASFAARETFVATMGTLYGIADGPDAEGTLAARLRNAKADDGIHPRYTTRTAVALMAFYVLALMCTSTVTMTARETGGGWEGAGWAALQFGWMLLLAYGSAWAIVRGGAALGWGGA